MGKFIIKNAPYFVVVGVLGIVYLSILYLLTILPKNEIIGASLIHILAGTIVAFGFLFLLLTFMRPRLLLSPNICFKEGGYWFKIVNRSIYHAFDVKIELFKMVPVPNVGGRSNVNIYPVKLRTSDWTSMNRFRKKYNDKDPFSLFAQTIFTDEDIATPLKKNGTYLVLQVTARHGLTGLADRFVQQFPNESVISAGHKFAYGINLSTIPENQSF